MPPDGTIVAFEGVTKHYGTTVAVDGIDLAIREGEFFALLGPSGCGKTTIMRMLAGFEVPSAGRILLDGNDIARLPPHRRPVNMMFQSYALFPHMTLERNIAFGLRQERLPKAAIAERVDRMLALVQLEPFRHRKPHQLSGGQRQRAALARSIAKQPRILLLDEPLAALDKKLRTETQLELVDIQEKLGITFVVVTHDQDEAMTVADRIAVMDHGRIVQIASPRAIYEAPANRYVAEFIGEANLLEGTLKAVADGVAAVDWNGRELACRTDAAPAPGSGVCVALRPEKVRLTAAGADPGNGHPRPGEIFVAGLRDRTRPRGPNTFRGKVEDILYVGSLSTYRVALEDGQRLVAQVTNERRVVERTISWDDAVWVQWDVDAGTLLTC